MLDAHQLNIFLIACETLNFTQAAQRLHMSQPSISQHIQSLERQLGVDLFERSGRQLHLSDAGVALVPLASELVQQSVLIEESMASLQGEIFGHLKVGCSTTPGKYVLPHLLARFHYKHPRVKVTCQVSPQANAIEKLCDGSLHFALSSHSHQEIYNDAEFRLFMKDPIILIAPLNHPWAQREQIDPEELLQVEFIFREVNSGTYSAVEDALGRVNLSPHELNTMLTLGNSEAIALAIQEGLGVGFVSSTVVAGLRHQDIAFVTVRGVDICRDIYIGRHTRRPPTSAQIAFWNLIESLDPPIQWQTAFQDRISE